MFAVSSVDAAKLYYEALKSTKRKERPLKVATIFSFAANEIQDAIGDVKMKHLNQVQWIQSAKEFLSSAINDYNTMFKTSYGVEVKVSKLL